MAEAGKQHTAEHKISGTRGLIISSVEDEPLARLLQSSIAARTTRKLEKSAVACARKNTHAGCHRTGTLLRSGTDGSAVYSLFL
jgi:hypothetical protein